MTMTQQDHITDTIANTATDRPAASSVYVELRPAAADVLRQLFLKGPLFDGDVASKSGRDDLVNFGLAVRHDGYQQLTLSGLKVALANGLERVKDRRERELSEALAVYRAN